MTTLNRNALWAALALATGLLACGPGPKTDAGTGGGTGGGTGDGSCIDTSDCPDPAYFECVNSKCEPACRTPAQCGSARPPQFALPFCSGPLGCQCDEGKCVGSLCSADSDCGTQVCRNGACVAAPEASTVATCQVFPDLVVMRQGQKVKFWVSAWDASRQPVVLKAGAEFSVLGNAMTGATVTGTSAEFTSGTTVVSTATDAVQAKIGTVTCKAKAIVLPTAGAGEVAVAVTDELSGRPVQGAKVVISTETGTVVGSGGTTDATGFASVSFGSNTKYSVSVFHADFGYVTVANYTGSARFLSVPLRRNPLDKHGGYKGTFTNVPMTGNVHAAVAGMSLAGSITNLNIAQLLGPTIPTDVKIGTTIDQKGIPIPAGAFLGFGEQQIKNRVAGIGLNGVCADEAKVLAGTCGTRAAWALAGDVPLSDLPISAFTSGVDNIDVSMLLAKIVPIFKKFNSSIVRDVQFDLQNLPKTDGKPDYSAGFKPDGTGFYTAQDHNFTQIPLAFNFAAKLPALPQYKGTFVDGVAIIGGASAIGRGVIPLGIGIGVNNNPVDSSIDKLEPLPAGYVGVRMAPTHHGIEGAHYGLVVAAVSAKALNDASAGIGASTLFPRLPNNKLVFDPAGSTPVDLSNRTFLPYPDGAKFNFTNTADGAVPGRSFRLATAISGGSVLRISFADNQEARWDVLVDPSSSGFTLPQAPATFRDRLFADGLTTGVRSSFTVQIFKLQRDPFEAASPTLSFADYVEFNDTNPDRTTDFLTAFSFLLYSAPTITWTNPANTSSTTTTTVARGSKLNLQVRGFSIGTGATNDGVVKLTFTGGTGCTAVTFNTDTPAASGKLEHTLPTACTGALIDVKAQLFQRDTSTPVTPAVSSSIKLTIQ